MMVTEDNYKGPGIYKHYKGGEYEVLGLALHEHGKENSPGFDPHNAKYHQVIYRPRTPGSMLFGSPCTMWIRRLSNFNEIVVPEFGETPVPRFTKIG